MSVILHVGQFGYPWEVRTGKINRALRASGYQVEIVVRRRAGEPGRQTHGEGTIHRVGPAGALSTPVPGNALWFHRIRKVARQIGAGAILVRDIPLALTAARVARALRVPLILDMAEHYPEAMRSWKKYRSGYLSRLAVHEWRIPDLIERKAVSVADGIIVVCEEQRERLVREYGYPEDRTCLVMNTPEPGAWTEIRKGSTSPSPHRFGYHGILCDDRELEVVLRGFDTAADSAPAITLLLAGGGESEAELRELASTLDNRHRVRFTGRYAPDDLAKLYGEVDFGIVSLRKNLFTEHTVANKFFDYAALGKPFLYPDIGPLSRLMKRMRCGAPYTAGSPESAARAFLALLDADYAELSANGVNSIEQEYNWDVDAVRLSAFVGRYISKGRKPA